MLIPIAAVLLAGQLTPAPRQVPTSTFSAGEYRLVWDDFVDEKLEGDKRCDISVRIANGKLFGSFKGLSEGRHAQLEGQIDTALDSSLVTFRQIEQDYVCGYQLVVRPKVETRLSPLINAVPVYLGVWHDTRGRRGDFALYKYQ